MPTDRPTPSAWLGDILDDHLRTASTLRELLATVQAIGEHLVSVFDRGGRVYTFGNGGSAAEAQHFAGELIGHYRRDRRPLPCLALVGDAAVLTCTANDYDYDAVFARQVNALVGPGDAVCAFTTSGRSANVVTALETAQRHGATTILFGGSGGGPALAHADLAVVVESSTTARIQEMHTTMMHMVSEHLDAWAAGTEPSA